MKKFLLNRLLEPSTWVGIALIVSAFLAPWWFIVLLGIILIVSGDSWLKAWVEKNAPGIVAHINDLTD